MATFITSTISGEGYAHLSLVQLTVISEINNFLFNDTL